MPVSRNISTAAIRLHRPRQLRDIVAERFTSRNRRAPLKSRYMSMMMRRAVISQSRARSALAPAATDAYGPTLKVRHDAHAPRTRVPGTI
jgi:hypothetical protein